MEGNTKLMEAGRQPHGSWVELDGRVMSAAVDTWIPLSLFFDSAGRVV